MIALRSHIFNVGFVLLNAAWFVGCIPSLFFNEYWFFRLALKPWARSNLWWLDLAVGSRHRIIGLENVPQGGAVIACKHQSAWETLAIVSVIDRPTVIFKRELLFVPLFGLYLLKSGGIAIRRKDGSALLSELTARTAAAVRSGRRLILFPEGTRRAVDAEPKYKSGVFYLAEAAGAPTVPAAHNAGLVWPRRGFIKKPGLITLAFLPPIEAQLDRSAYMARLVAAIEDTTRRLVAEQRASGR